MLKSFLISIDEIDSLLLTIVSKWSHHLLIHLGSSSVVNDQSVFVLLLAIWSKIISFVMCLYDVNKLRYSN